jgi:hypothetical protein
MEAPTLAPKKKEKEKTLSIYVLQIFYSFLHQNDLDEY